MLSEFIRTHKIITTTIILAVVGLIGFSAFISVSRAGKEPVEVFLIPSDAKLTVGDQQFGPGTAYLKPGTYEISATREGFADYTGTIAIKSPNTSTIDIALEPESESAKQWAQENQQLYFDYEGRAGIRAATDGTTFREQHPIVDHLPLREFVYTIGYHADPDDPDNIILDIDAITGYRNAAIEQIRKLGFDPTNFEINFRNYESPFSHE